VTLNLWVAFTPLPPQTLFQFSR